MRNYFFFLLLCIGMNQTILSQITEVIAHRGAFKNNELPENSIASLKAAAEQKVWGSEFDIHLTSDDRLVINHDNDFYGVDIPSSTYKELLEKKHPNGESIPTAEEYLKEGKKHKDLKLIAEIKTNPQGKERTREAVRKTYALVEELGIEDQVVFIAFSYDACLTFRDLDDNVEIQYLNGDKSPRELKEDGLTGFDYNQNVLKDNPDWIEKAHELGLTTNVWTVNKEENLRFFIEEGIGFITTDEPEMTQDILEQEYADVVEVL